MARLQGKKTAGWVWVVLLIILAIIVIGLVASSMNPTLLPISLLAA